jgi:hypothetical protein
MLIQERLIGACRRLMLHGPVFALDQAAHVPGSALPLGLQRRNLLDQFRFKLDGRR